MDFLNSLKKNKVQGMEEMMQKTELAKELGGEALLADVVEKTGLAGNLIESELSAIVENAGHSASNITLEQLRAAMLNYLEELNLNIQADEESLDVPATGSDH
jgi:hypothetical protein